MLTPLAVEEPTMVVPGDPTGAQVPLEDVPGAREAGHDELGVNRELRPPAG
jgi:hypothetical protein